jgi:hypothetical protein
MLFPGVRDFLFVLKRSSIAEQTVRVIRISPRRVWANIYIIVMILFTFFFLTG